MTLTRVVTERDVVDAVHEATDLWQPNLQTEFADMVSESLFRNRSEGSDLAEVVNSLARGWMDQTSNWDWCVYEIANNAIYFPQERTREDAEREAELCGSGHMPLPYFAARAMSNAYNHGRASTRNQATEDR